MSTWLSFVTGSWAGPVCLAVTVVGLVLSVVAWRRKGARSGIRGMAWSLLPLAVYLVHALALVGRLVAAVVAFAGSFIFSPKAWLGVILIGIAVVLFLVSGGIPLVGSRKRREKKKERALAQRSAAGGAATGSAPAVRASRKQPAVPADDDDLSDVRDILKRHGIS